VTRSEVVAHGRPYTVSTLGPRAPGHAVQAIAFARVVDALTGDPVRAPARMTAPVRGLLPRSTSDGVVGLLGRPSQVFPSLRTQPYDLAVRIDAAGYAPRTEAAVLAAVPSFPGAFAPADLGELALLPDPVALDLSTSEDLGPAVAPLGGADVHVSRWWATVDRVGGAGSLDPLVAVAPGLSALRPTGSTVDTPVLVQPPEAPRTLTAGLARGATRVPVSAVGAFAPGDVLALDAGDPDRGEWLEVVDVVPVGSPGSAGEVGVRFPLQQPHVAGAAVRRLASPAPGATQAVLTADALAGGRTLVVGALGSIAVGQVVRVSGGASAPEYQVAGLYRTSTDASGRGRLPPLTGLAAIEISAAAGALAATTLVTLTRPRTTRSLDLTLR
jgi:hypothetical protein